jgi:hypothetical protein
MIEENSTVPAGEVESAPEAVAEIRDDNAPEIETDAEEHDAENDNPDSNEEGEPEPVEEIEFNFGGNKLKVPKGSIPDELAAEIDKFTSGTWSDYTRKSQDVAERAKLLEAQEVAVQKLSTMNGELLTSFSRGQHIKNELEQLSKINVDQLWQSNPDQARRVSDVIAQKQAELSNIIRKVDETETSLMQTQQQEVERRMTVGRQLVEREIKDFAAREPEIIDYVVKNYGMTPDEAKTWPLNPNTAKMAYKAMMYDRMQATAKNKSSAPKPEQAKPFTPSKGKGGASVKDATSMSVSEMKKYLGLPG